MSQSTALAYNTRQFLRPEGKVFQDRIQDFRSWIDQRIQTELYQYGRTLAGAPGPETPVFDSEGRVASSLNFASQDYLGLSSHPQVQEAAIRVIRDFGVHSAGSPMVIGETHLSRDLAKAIGEHLNMKHVLIYPTGWAAGFGAITGLVRNYDHIVLDRLAHASLQLGATSSTTKIYRHDHLDIVQAEATLREIRTRDPKGAIMVVNEGIFSMDADAPDLRRLQEVCRSYDALLLVDVAHDLGSTGPNGTGEIGRQGMLGDIDLVMGSFSKTFASNGGFVATNSDAVFEYLRMFSNSYMFSNALSPIQAAIVSESFRIVRSEEGEGLRRSVLNNATAMREQFEKHSIRSYGKPCPIVPVPIGGEAHARLLHRDLRHRNIAAMVIEFPIVAVGSSRLRIQLMANHKEEQVRRGADEIADSLQTTRAML